MSRVKSSGRVSRPPAPRRVGLRAAIESFDTIEVVAPEMRKIIEECFPDLGSKLPPRKPPARSARRRGSKS